MKRRHERENKEKIVESSNHKIVEDGQQLEMNYFVKPNDEAVKSGMQKAIAVEDVLNVINTPVADQLVMLEMKQKNNNLCQLCGNTNRVFPCPKFDQIYMCQNCRCSLDVIKHPKNETLYWSNLWKKFAQEGKKCVKMGCLNVMGGGCLFCRIKKMAMLCQNFESERMIANFGWTENWTKQIGEFKQKLKLTMLFSKLAWVKSSEFERAPTHLQEFDYHQKFVEETGLISAKKAAEPTKGHAYTFSDQPNRFPFFELHIRQEEARVDICAQLFFPFILLVAFADLLSAGVETAAEFIPFWSLFYETFCQGIGIGDPAVNDDNEMTNTQVKLLFEHFIMPYKRLNGGISEKEMNILTMLWLIESFKEQPGVLPFSPNKMSEFFLKELLSSYYLNGHSGCEQEPAIIRFNNLIKLQTTMNPIISKFNRQPTNFALKVQHFDEPGQIQARDLLSQFQNDDCFVKEFMNLTIKRGRSMSFETEITLAAPFEKLAKKWKFRDLVVWNTVNITPARTVPFNEDAIANQL